MRDAVFQASTLMRWAVLHGAQRAVLSVQARRGQPLARILVGQHRGGDPYPLMEEIRASGRLVRTPFVLATADHELCRTILRDSRFGVASSGNLGHLPRPIQWLMRKTDPHLPNPVEPPSMLQSDPPAHSRCRRPVAQTFTPRAVERLGNRVTEVAEELLRDLESNPEPDLIADYAAPLPVAVILEMLGVPTALGPRILELGFGGAPLLDVGLSWGTFRHAIEVLRDADQFLSDHIVSQRANPGSDVLSQMIASGELSTRELGVTASLLIGAGFETTVNLIGNGIALLLNNPDQLAALRADPDLWPVAVEEILRLESPVQITARMAKSDVELAGHSVKSGEIVVLLLAGANRDPAVFPNPTRFDLTRPNAKDHLAFSTGVHMCLGASLGRLEGAIALRALFERFPDLSLDGEPAPRGLATLHGFRCLPVKTGLRAAAAKTSVAVPSGPVGVLADRLGGAYI